jgi:tRNA-specific 2-thiouridylase
VLHRDASRVDRLRLRHHGRPLACRIEAPAGGELLAALSEPAYGVAPGQTASLLAGDLVVGHGTIV